MRLMKLVFGNVFERFSQDLGVDLGTANTLVYVRNRGIVINEPSVIAINQKTGQILAIGEEAKKMVGRTPSYIVATRPLVNGVVADFEATEQILRYFIRKVQKSKLSFLSRPRVVIGIPSEVTEVERKAVEDAAILAGAGEVYLIEEPMATAIGARLPIQEALGNMVVDIGGGTTDISVISLGGVVLEKTLKVAGDKLNQDIVQYAYDEFNLLLGERTAERVKIEVGSALPLENPLTTTMRGRDSITGLPKEIEVDDEHIREAISPSVKTIVEAVREIVEMTPPELIGDIMERGIILSGGGSLLRGLGELISQETLIPSKIVDDPLTTVARGCGIVLENSDSMKEVLVFPSSEEDL